MTQSCLDVLIVEPDEGLATMIADHLSRAVQSPDLRVRTNVHHAATAAEAGRRFQATPPDVVVSELELPDADGLSMLARMRARADSAFIVVARRASLGQAVELMRLRTRDLLIKPCDLRRLGRIVAHAAHDQYTRRRAETRQRRLRDLTGRVIRERRELRRRMDLVCCDLVGAYRQLAERFAAHTTGEPAGE